MCLLRLSPVGVALVTLASVFLVIADASAINNVDNEKLSYGDTSTSCVTVGSSAVDWDTIAECQTQSGHLEWMHGPLYVGTTTDTCPTNGSGQNIQGMISFDSTNHLLQYCGPNGWTHM